MLTLAILPVAAADSRVFDYAQVFSEAENQEISKAINLFIFKTGMDLAVLTVNQYLDDMTDHELARAYFLLLDLGIGGSNSRERGALQIDPVRSILA